ncbi:unnamed protein product [Mytilus coruscus]|uniref:Uncharacterized protein n=1 Tax=Mytilus coruscus TaxID=42192 RepID=A0A6J8ANG3_MYTCO|nr:unnamed protein product [Mytilus coruscus]
MTRRPMELFSNKLNTRIGTWNVRTLYQSGKCAQVAKEMDRYKIEILGLSEKDKEVKKNCKHDKRDYVEQLAQEAEIACSKGDIKSLYNTTKQLSCRRSNSNATVKDKNGNVITKIEEQLKRWKDDFEEVLNRPPPTDPPNIEGRQVLNIKTGDIT